jgi:hypothetical protein
VYLDRDVRGPQPMHQGTVLEEDDPHVRGQTAAHAHHADLGAAQLGRVPEDENLHLHAP